METTIGQGRMIHGNVRIHHHICTVIEAEKTAVGHPD